MELSFSDAVGELRPFINHLSRTDIWAMEQQDITQECMCLLVQFLRDKKTLPTKTDFYKYYKRVAKNRIIDFYRRSATRKKHTDASFSDLDVFFTREDNPEITYQRKHSRQKAAGFLKCLRKDLSKNAKSVLDNLLDPSSLSARGRVHLSRACRLSESQVVVALNEIRKKARIQRFVKKYHTSA